jgi:predicted nuclease of restriction endonuclease-like (RecB) superfamily
VSKGDLDDQPASLAQRPPGYTEWLTDLKSRIHAAQQRAALAVNGELLLLYWQLGRDILERQAQAGWGAGIVDQVSADLRAAFPDAKGFSRTNLLYMRAFAEAWPEPAIVQQAVGRLPWGHNLVLPTKLKTTEARLAYAEQAVARGWSRNVLGIHIEQRTLEREGKALTNFEHHLPKRGRELLDPAERAQSLLHVGKLGLRHHPAIERLSRTLLQQVRREMCAGTIIQRASHAGDR